MGNTKRSADAMRIALALEKEGNRLDISPVGWGTVKRQDIVAQLLERINGHTNPDQGYLGFCGGATFFYCLLKDRPDLYAQLIVDLWKTGKARLGTLELEPGIQLLQYTDTAVDKAEINAVDWMTMASVRDFDGKYKAPSHTIGQATIGTTLKHWFNAVGAKTLMDNTHILGRASWAEFLDISCYSSSSWIVMLINANLLKAYTKRGSGSFVADHWVVVSNEITVNNIPAALLRPAVNNRGCINPRSTVPADPSMSIDFRVFSWGDDTALLHEAPNTSVAGFLDRYHGAFVFSHIP